MIELRFPYMTVRELRTVFQKAKEFRGRPVTLVAWKELKPHPKTPFGIRAKFTDLITTNSFIKHVLSISRTCLICGSPCNWEADMDKIREYGVEDDICRLGDIVQALEKTKQHHLIELAKSRPSICASCAGAFFQSGVCLEEFIAIGMRRGARLGGHHFVREAPTTNLFNPLKKTRKEPDGWDAELHDAVYGEIDQICYGPADGLRKQRMAQLRNPIASIEMQAFLHRKFRKEMGIKGYPCGSDGKTDYSRDIRRTIQWLRQSEEDVRVALLTQRNVNPLKGWAFEYAKRPGVMAYHLSLQERLQLYKDRHRKRRRRGWEQTDASKSPGGH